MVALACHELGHALAAKHAGRRVPVAGFLVYFGIPSRLRRHHRRVDGRPAGPAASPPPPARDRPGAGRRGSSSSAWPSAELAPWAFKLAFAWYLNALFNLNPFMALDGYYLLMDWLEVPNLRARGLAWIVARLRRRPPRFGELDREGRLVALYGMLAVVWLRSRSTSSTGCTSTASPASAPGLWHAGWAGRRCWSWCRRAVVARWSTSWSAGCAAGGGRRARTARRGAGLTGTCPAGSPRCAARRSASLPPDALAELADDARWVRPATGEQLVFAGAAQPTCTSWSTARLEARRPGDPGGTVRRAGRRAAASSAWPTR